MLEELKKKNKTYAETRTVLHKIENYEELILDEIKNNLKGQGYEKIYDIYEKLVGETLKFPLQSVNEGITGVSPDFLLIENKFIANERARFQNFFKEIKNELRSSEKFFFAVSFIKHSGLQLLLKELTELEEKGVEGEILTSTYMNITEPKALSKLLSFKNIKVKLYKGKGESFHTKAYFFQRENNLSSLILGSSNLSHEALCNGREWNIRISEKLEKNLFINASNEFENLWNSSETLDLDKELLEKYETHFEKNKNSNFENFWEEKEEKTIKANKVQENILSNLSQFRQQGKEKAIVISATGTGKTYLSAFDVKNFNPERMLFIAHREELLDNGINTFRRLFPYKKMGKLSANEKSFDSSFLFATVQSLGKNLQEFKKTHFDYIIIDEFHHAAADTYKNILSYFQSKFLLGLTATPERMDGKDIMALCDYNIAGEVRIREALEKELLAPFHYFGIADEKVDYSFIRRKNGKFDEKDLSEKLSINERTDYIIEKIRLYDYNGTQLKAIGFCVDINHAKKMSEDFAKKGFRVASISSNDTMERRQKTLKDFKKGLLEIIFTVDIFNEGIDIPEINMLLFLRPTESSTIFTQQLGRGLRKTKDKEYVTILDFIGNYNKDFLLPSLFIPKGQNRNDLASIKKQVIEEFHNLPKESFIELDRICQKRILDNLEKVKINSNSHIIKLYEDFKADLGKIPEITDFLYSELDLELIINSFDSYAKFLSKYEKINFDFEEREFDFIKILEKKLPIKWPYEFLLIKLIINKKNGTTQFPSNGQRQSREPMVGKLRAFAPNPIKTKIKLINPVMPEQLQKSIDTNMLLDELQKQFGQGFNKPFHKELIANLTKELGEKFVLYDNKFNLSKDFELSLEKENFKLYIENLCTYALNKFKIEFDIEKFNDFPLVEYKNYSRVELQYLLQSTAEKGSWRAGYSVANKDICLFITLNKDENLEEHLKYDNFFKGQDIVQWISQNKTSHDSPIGELYVKHIEKGYKVHIFLRKYSVFLGKAMDFTYVGQGNYYSSHGDKPMYILWKLHNKIPEEFYLDL